MDRRLFLQRGLGGCAVLATAFPAAAQFRVEISGIGAAQVPVAIARFRDEDKALHPVSQIVRADLERSGLFKLVSAPDNLDENARPVFAEWRSRNADALAAGTVTRLADGRYDLRYRLWDVVKGTELIAQSLAVPKDDLRLAAHRIADDIYQKLTGERGIFSTRIADVSKGAGRYTLFVADADGEGSRSALGSAQPIISPA